MTINKRNHYTKQKKYFQKEFSAVIDYRLAPWQKSYIQRIKKDLLKKNYKEKTLLDIATGSGYVAIEMAKLGMNVIACDLSKESIKNLNRYKKEFGLKNLKIIECYAEKIPLKDKTVDYIVANAILEHIPEENDAVAEWKRLLKKDGRIFITVPLKFRYIYPFLWIMNYIHDKRIGHLRRYDKETLKNRFKLPLKNVYYSGHLIKVFGIIISIIVKSSKYDDFFENQDRKTEKRIYGANNISVIFSQQ